MWPDRFLETFRDFRTERLSDVGSHRSQNWGWESKTRTTTLGGDDGASLAKLIWEKKWLPKCNELYSLKSMSHVLCISTTLFWRKVEEALFVFRAFERKAQKRKGFSVFWRKWFRISLTTFLTRVFVVVFARGEHCMMKKACVRGTENDAGYTEQLFSLARWQRCETTFQGSTDKPSLSKKHWNLHSKIHYQTTCHHPNLGFPISSPPKVLSAAALLIFSRPSGKVSSLGDHQPMWSMRQPHPAGIHQRPQRRKCHPFLSDAEGIIQSWDPGLKVTYGQSVAAARLLQQFLESRRVSPACLFCLKMGCFFLGGGDDWLKWLCPTPLGFFVVVILLLRLKLKMWPKLSNDLTSHIKLARGPILAGVYQIPST